jgi:hypothetical protein
VLLKSILGGVKGTPLLLLPFLLPLSLPLVARYDGHKHAEDVQENEQSANALLPYATPVVRHHHREYFSLPFVY